MKKQKPLRTRVVNFRLTEQEYEKVMAACEEKGSRCLSDFARIAILGMAGFQPANQATIDVRLQVLDQRLFRLIRMMERSALRTPGELAPEASQSPKVRSMAAGR